jgi:excisionase family DNA binding protein
MNRGPSNISETRRRALRLAFPEPAARPSIVTTRLLRSGEVAALLQVSRRSIAAWASRGLIPFIETPGGHRRFRAADVRALVESLDRGGGVEVDGDETPAD